MWVLYVSANLSHRECGHMSSKGDGHFFLRWAKRLLNEPPASNWNFKQPWTAQKAAWQHLLQPTAMWQSRDNTPLSFSLPPTLVHPHVTLPFWAEQHFCTESFGVVHLIHCLLSCSPTHSALSFFHCGFSECVQCTRQNSIAPII